MKVIGQQLRASLKLEPDQPESFRGQIDGCGNWRSGHQQLFPLTRMGNNAAEVGSV